jgi:hypothetical protein
VHRALLNWSILAVNRCSASGWNRGLNEAPGASLLMFSRSALFIEGLASRKRGWNVPNSIESRKQRPSGKTLGYLRTMIERPRNLGFSR